MTSLADIELSFRRTRTRPDLMLAMDRLKEAHHGEVASAIEVSCGRLVEILHGAPPSYKRELSPVPLGLLTDDDGVIRITPLGEVFARRLHARRSRLRTRFRL